MAILLVLIAFVQCGWGSSTLAAQIGSINILNLSVYDMTILTSTCLSSGGSQSDPSDTPLPHGAYYSKIIVDGMDCVEAS